MLNVRKPDSWWFVPRPNPHAALRLFCFPYAGGNAFVYRSWVESLPPTVEVCGVQYPGRGRHVHQPPMTRIPALVAELGPALTPVLDRPFAFFGHSLGALVSFELARWLRRHRSVMPRHLFVSARRAPHLRDTDPPLHQKSDEEFLGSISALNGTPAEVLADPGVLRFLLPVLRADFELGETYEYVSDEPLACPITAFGGSEDEETLDGRLEEWSLQTTSPFSRHVLPGGHFFIQSSGEALKALVRWDLSRVIA